MSKEDNRRYLILKDPNIYKGLILLALPVMLNNFIKTIHDLVDMFFVAKIPNYSAEAVSSISITFPVLFTFLSLGIGVSIAGTSLISQLVGSAQINEAKRYAANLFLLSLVIGLSLNILSYFGAPSIMKMMGAEGYLLAHSVSYLQIRSFELIFVFIFFAFTSIRQADGDTVTPVIFGIITIILNIILSPILISVLNLGVDGAAYATLFSNVAVIPFILYQLFFSKKNSLKISYQDFKITKVISKTILKTALPASSGQALTAIGFILMTKIIISYGTDTVAAFSVGNRLSSLVLQPVFAMGSVLVAYIGQNIGNLNVPRAKETFKKAMILSVTTMAILSIIALPLREPLAKVFLGNDPVALELTIKSMFYLIIGLPLMAIFQTFIGTFIGTGNTKFSFTLSVIRLWVLRIPLIMLFKYFTNLGSSGIWTAMLISNFIIAFVGYFLYNKLNWDPKYEV